MRLRPRQKTFVERSVAALASRGNTLGVAPTGAGKTIMLSAVTGEMIGDGAKACVLAHRDELTAQNRAKFQRVVPGVATSVIDATEKSWNGQVAFAMVPTLARASNLADMPRLDLLVVDEAHHAVADSYRRIIDRVREANPDARIFGVTATPNRGDRKGLREVFDNVADQVRLAELIASGHLVPPRTFVIDVGVQDELRSVRKTMSDFDMAEVAGTILAPAIPASAAMGLRNAGFHLVETLSVMVPVASGFGATIDPESLCPAPATASLRVRTEAAEVHWMGRSVVLSHQLFPVFQRLLEKALSRDQAASSAHVEGSTGREAKDLIRELRAALVAAGFTKAEAETLIVTVRGRGYRLGIPANSIMVDGW